MQTIANLTVSDWVKISPDLKWSFERAAKFPKENIHWLETRGIITFWMPAIFGSGAIRADVLITHVDGFQYWLPDYRLPQGWTAEMWTDFVVGIVKSPYVLEAGTVRELPVIRSALAPKGAIAVNSPTELAQVAGRAPASTVTPQPTPGPIVTPFVPPTPNRGGFIDRVANDLGVPPVALGIGAAALVGLVILGVATSGRKPKAVRSRSRRRR